MQPTIRNFDRLVEVQRRYDPGNIFHTMRPDPAARSLGGAAAPERPPYPRTKASFEPTASAADTHRVIGPRLTPSTDDHLDSSSARLADCDQTLSTIAADVAGLLEELAFLRAAAGQLADRQSEQDALFARQQLELAEHEAERVLARSRAAELDEAETRLRESDERAASLAQELQTLRTPAAARNRSPLSEVGLEEPPTGHVRFVAYPDGYRLLSSDERCARSGDVVEVDGRSFLVTRVGRSPLPGDRRPCAYLTTDTSAA